MMREGPLALNFTHALVNDYCGLVGGGPTTLNDPLMSKDGRRNAIHGHVVRSILMKEGNEGKKLLRGAEGAEVV